MSSKYTEKKINALFVLCIVFAVSGIISAIAYFVHNHINLTGLKTEDLKYVRLMLFAGISIILISLFLVKKYVDKILTFLLGIIFVALSALPLDDYVKSQQVQLVNITVFSIFITTFLLVLSFCVIIFAFIFKREKTLALENDQRKEALEFEMNQYFDECEKDVNLLNLMAHYSIIDKNIELYEKLPIKDNEKEVIAEYKKRLLNEKQKHIKRVIINHYKIIYKGIEIKQLQLSEEIYSSSQDLKNYINRFANQFDEENQKISSMILERTNLIIAFIKKYINAYNPNIEHNIDSMNGHYFEKYCAYLLTVFGFVDVSVTRGSGDQGVDIIGKYNDLKYAIQCKRHSHKLGNTPIQEVAAGKNYYKCDGAIVITNNFFTDGAIDLAKANNVELWDRNKLMQLIFNADDQWDHLIEKTKIDFEKIDIV